MAVGSVQRFVQFLDAKVTNSVKFRLKYDFLYRTYDFLYRTYDFLYRTYHFLYRTYHFLRFFIIVSGLHYFHFFTHVRIFVWNLQELHDIAAIYLTIFKFKVFRKIVYFAFDKT